MRIRPAQPQDIEQIIELCEAHAKYEAYNFQKKDKAEALFNYLFVDKASIHCLVVTNHFQLLGYATYMKQFSTWEVAHYLYLDCLFLLENARGKGIGQKMMNEIKAMAKKMECSWIEWQTPKFNEDAIRFYQRIGASSKSKERFCWEVSF